MIIVTGASGGLGRRVLSDLYSDFCDLDKVVGIYFRNKPPQVDGSVRFFQVDVTDCKSIEYFIQSTKDELTHITLVNLAGSYVHGLAINLTPTQWDQVMSVNLKGSFLMSQALLPFMMRERWGRIINFSSSFIADSGIPGMAAYAASKAGVVSLTRTLAYEYGWFNITVNCLSLGCFSEGMSHQVPESVRRALLKRIPLRKFGDPIEVSRAITYLIAASYTNGSIIDINGGLN